MSGDFPDQDVIGYHREGIALEIVVMSIRDGTAQRQPGLLVHRPGVPRRRADLLVHRPLLRPRRAAARRGPAADRDRRRRPQGRVADRAARRDDRPQEEGGGLVPRSGAIGGRLVDLANKNAASSFATRRNARADVELALGKLQRRLKLPQLPRVIECYDVSHLQGFATVASMVVFVDGRPDKSRYRTYKVRAPGAGRARRHNDDFASMYEVLSRRFRRAREGRPTTPGTAGSSPTSSSSTAARGSWRWRWRPRATSASTSRRASGCRSSRWPRSADVALADRRRERGRGRPRRRAEAAPAL